MPVDQVTLRFGKADHGRLVTADEYENAECEEPYRFERVKGKLVLVTQPPFAHEMAYNPWLVRFIRHQLSYPDIIDFVLAVPAVHIDDDNDRVGDLGVYLKASNRGVDPPRRVPDLIIEVLSPGREAWERDFVEKREQYHRSGIREYLVIDRFKKSVTVFTYEQDRYAEQVLTRTDVYATPLLPGLAIALADVF